MLLSYYCKPELKYKFCTQILTDSHLKNSIKNIKTLYFEQYKQYNNIYNSLIYKVSQYLTMYRKTLAANKLNNLQRVN